MPGTAMRATCSRDWVGGDARGLQEVAERLSRIESALESEAYLAAMDGVHIGEDGAVVGYAGPRVAAAEQLRGLYQKRMASAI